MADQRRKRRSAVRIAPQAPAHVADRAPIFAQCVVDTWGGPARAREGGKAGSVGGCVARIARLDQTDAGQRAGALVVGTVEALLLVRARGQEGGSSSDGSVAVLGTATVGIGNWAGRVWREVQAREGHGMGRWGFANGRTVAYGRPWFKGGVSGGGTYAMGRTRTHQLTENGSSLSAQLSALEHLNKTLRSVWSRWIII